MEQLTINKDCTPEQFDHYCNRLTQAGNAYRFALGDAVTVAQEKGWIGRESFKVLQESSGYSLRSLQSFSQTARAFPIETRSKSLEFSHYAELAKLPAAERMDAATVAADEGLSVKEIRRRLRDDSLNTKTYEWKGKTYTDITEWRDTIYMDAVGEEYNAAIADLEKPEFDIDIIKTFLKLHSSWGKNNPGADDKRVVADRAEIYKEFQFPEQVEMAMAYEEFRVLYGVVGHRPMHAPDKFRLSDYEAIQNGVRVFAQMQQEKLQEFLSEM